MQNKLATALVLALLALLTWLIITARQGDRASIAILASLATLFLIVVGWGLSNIQRWIEAKREAQRFSSNIEENTKLLLANQRAQTEQTRSLLNQAKAQKYLAPAEEEEAPFTFDEGIFEESVLADLDDV